LGGKTTIGVIMMFVGNGSKPSTDREKSDQLTRKNYRTKDTFIILTKQNTILDKYRLHRKWNFAKNILEMKAIVLNQAGSVDNFIYQEVERPTPQKGEILIKTKYVGVNPMDSIVRGNEQLLTHFLGEKRPAILGWDVSGDVVAIGEAVTDFNIGDAVFTCVLGGGYAEYVVAKPEHTVHKPKNISYQEAAAVPIAAIPAWEALVKIAQIKQGDKVLIHAGSGGVGHFAIQIAKSYGAYVIATSFAKNKDFVLSLGADRHIDYQSENFYDVLSDIVLF